MANEVRITFNEFAQNGAQEATRAVIVETMVRVRANAVALAPVDLGELRNSIMWRKGWGSDVFGSPDDGGFNEAGGEKSQRPLPLEVDRDEGIVGTNSDHWYPEFGTRFQVAQPFMRPAGDAVRGADASEIAKTWGPEAMKREYAKRKRRVVRK